MQTLQIAPATMRAPWLILPIAAIPIVVVTLVVFGVVTGLKAQFEVSTTGLRLSGDFYGRTIPASDLRGGSARRVDIGTERRSSADEAADGNEFAGLPSRLVSPSQR